MDLEADGQGQRLLNLSLIMLGYAQYNKFCLDFFDVWSGQNCVMKGCTYLLQFGRKMTVHEKSDNRLVDL